MARAPVNPVPVYARLWRLTLNIKVLRPLRLHDAVKCFLASITHAAGACALMFSSTRLATGHHVEILEASDAYLGYDAQKACV
jgi:hypothetical protein